jgi:putative transposase
MKFRFIEQHGGTWPVRLMCRVLGVSASGYDAWRSRPESQRARENRALLADVQRLQERHKGRYGSPRMHAALRAEGRGVSRGRIERLMRRQGIRALAGRRYRPCTTDSDHPLPVAPNLLQQTFVAAAPNRVWLADITYLATGEGWLYLAAVLDLATRKVVGWAMREHMRTELTLAALMMAAQRQRPAAGLICHSDRGSQYAAEAYRSQLASIGAHASMSRTGWGSRQRSDGELLPHAQSRTRPSALLGNPRRGTSRPVRLHRGLLQSTAPPLSPWVPYA